MSSAGGSFFLFSFWIEVGRASRLPDILHLPHATNRGGSGGEDGGKGERRKK